MRARTWGGLFFLTVILSYFAPVFCSPSPEFDLEPIVVSKSKIHLLDSYAVSLQSIENFPFGSPIEALINLPVDLQSRSPKGGIQTDFSLRGLLFRGY